MIKIVLTCGDINGIGPEIAIKSINILEKLRGVKFILIIPKNIFEKTANIITPEFDYEFIQNNNFTTNKKVILYDIGSFKDNLGKPTKSSGIASYTAILKAFELVKNKIANAIVTAPISKTSFNLASINYPGHTELFADLTKTKKFLMTFISKKIICALVTIHSPLNKINRLITKEKVKTSLEILYNSLINDLGKANPKIAVLGLNPHAGEKGLIGNEEIEVIEPALKSFNKKNVFGPFVPDAFFGLQQYKNFDAVLGMYHDQVLIPFKMLNFNYGVNFTAGLPIVRTSPDHGTAFDIAGKGIANPTSMIEAIKWAKLIVHNRNKL